MRLRLLRQVLLMASTDASSLIGWAMIHLALHPAARECQGAEPVPTPPA